MSASLRVYLIAYDIGDDRRRSHMADLLLSYGERLQASVYLVSTHPASFVRMKESMKSLVNGEDSAIICDLGTYGKGKEYYTTLGHRVDDGLGGGSLVF